MTIADKIYELRSSRNMSLREFAKIAGVTHTTIARLESDTFETQKVYLDTLYLICRNLHYDFYKFLIETGYLKGSDVTDASTSEGGATEQERELLRYFRELSPYLQGIAINTVRGLTGAGAGDLHKKA